MQTRFASIRRDFASHHLSAGENIEDIAARFLTDHLPRKFGISSGIVISHEGAFSNQADLVVVDALNNSPLYAANRNQLWPVEAVYALVEVKTSLKPKELKDAIMKGRKFKTLSRHFCEVRPGPQITDSLFVIWGFDGPAPLTFKKNLFTALSDVPRSEQPDLIIVLNRIVAYAGTFLELIKFGQPDSPHRAQLHAQHGASLETLPLAEVWDLGARSLLAWYVWFDSWLRQAGSRLADPVRYLPPNQVFGNMV